MKKILIDTVTIANEIIMEIYSKSDFEIQIKKDNSPLTIADKKASDYICHRLSETFPDIPIVCEEIELIPYEKRTTFDKYWLIDPLDGTKEFIKRNGEFTVNIALIERLENDNFEPTIGIIGVPVTGDIYYGKSGVGSYKISKNGTVIELKCKPFDLTEPLIAVSSRSHGNDELTKLENLNIAKNIVSGSSLKFMKLCENEAQIYPRFHPCMEWDIAAAHVILKEAGGVILNSQNQTMKYNKFNLLVNEFVAYGRIKEQNGQ